MMDTCHTRKQLLASFLVIFVLIVSETSLKAQNTVGIGTPSPNSNAVLDLVSPNGNQGLLVPRISTGQRQAMASSLGSSDTGLIVFDTDIKQFFHWVETLWVAGLGAFSDIAGGDLQGNYPNPTLRSDAVTSTTILDGTISTPDLADGSVTTDKINSEGNGNSVLGTDAGGVPSWEPKSNFLGNSLVDGNILIGDGADVAQSRSVSGDISMANDGTVTISDQSITSSKILDQSISSSDIATDAIGTDELAAGSVGSTEIQDGAVTNPDLADNSVDSNKIQDNSVTAADIATGAVNTEEIVNGAVTSDKIADATIQSVDIADDAITSSNIVDGTIATDDIASGGNNKVLITTAAGTVFWENITLFETNTLAEGNIFVGDVTNTAAPLNARGAGRILIGDGTSVQSLNINGDISLSATGNAQIIPEVVGSAEVTDNSLSSDDIAPNAIESSELADNAVDNGAVQDNAISTSKIQDNAITTQKIASDAVNSSRIADGAVNTADLADDAVGTAKIDGEGSNNAVMTTTSAGNPQWESRLNFGTSSLPAANLFIGDASGISQPRPVSGDITLSTTGNVQINNDVIGTNEVTDNSLTVDDIGPNAIESSELADNSVDSGAIQAGAVTASKISDDAVSVAKIDGSGNNNSILTTDALGNPQWELKSGLDIDPTNEVQDLSLTGNILNLTLDATPVDLSGYLDNTDNQDLNSVLGQGNDAGGVVITNAADPINAQDLATKNYVDLLDAADSDGDPANELQDLSLAGNTLSLTGDASTVDLSGYLDNTDSQDLSLTGNTLSITGDATPVDLSTYLDNTDNQDLVSVLSQGNDAGGNAIINAADPTNAQDMATKNYVDQLAAADSDGDPTNELQDLSLAGNTLSLTNDASNVDLSGYLDNTDNQDLGNVLSQGNDAGGAAITNVANPTNNQDAATKNYVDNVSIGTSNIANDAVTNAKILDGTILNGDISGTANISAGKLEGSVMVESENVSLLTNDAGYLTSVSSTEITDGTIVNADINGSAAIDGSKINPDFGTQNIQTSGSLNSGTATVSSLTVTDLGGAMDTYTGDGAVNSFTISAGGAFSSSDKRLKENIKDIPKAMDRIAMVEGKRYTFINDKQQKLHYGVIAQELQKLFPHLVHEDENGYLSVNYLELIPVLIEALKEQQSSMEQLSRALVKEEELNQQLKVDLKQQKQLLKTQQFILTQLQIDRAAMEKDLKEIKQSLGLEAKK